MAGFDIKKPKNILIIVAALAVIVMFAYLSIYITSILGSITHGTTHYTYNLNGYINYHNILFYNQSKYLVPYFIVNYNYQNESNIFVNGSIYSEPIPRNVYLLNASNECINCDNFNALHATLANDLVSYGVINNVSNLLLINPNNLTQIRNNSILISPTGFLPSQLFQNVSENMTVFKLLMMRGTSLIYVGGALNYMVLPGSIQVINKEQPYQLAMGAEPYRNQSFYKSLFNSSTGYMFFQNATYTLTKGNNFWLTDYINILNGSFVAIPNYPNTWSTNNLSLALSKGTSELFWLPIYSSGQYHISNKNVTGNGKLGLFLTSTNLRYNQSSTALLNNSYARIELYTDKAYLIPNGSRYYYIYYNPKYTINGTISMPGYVIPEKLNGINITIFTHSNITQTIQPNINIKNQNGTTIYSHPLPYIKSSGNFSFIQNEIFNLSPGNYQFSVVSFSGYDYGTALLYVPPIQITPLNINFTNGTFLLYLTMNQQQLNNINYTINMTNNYSQVGRINDGLILYKLPQNYKEPYGNVSFDINMLNTKFPFKIDNPAINISLTSGDLYVLIVIIIVVILVVFVRDPIRDDFYVDVPSIPKQKSIAVAIKSKDIINAFDRLNAYYHWKYMPLNVDEIRTAIANNIRDNNVPLSLTYQNVELLVEELEKSGKLTDYDNLYAPMDWISRSGHDIEYLATFKKLRLWFVSHGYIINEIDTSSSADIIATIKGERIYIIIYSKTSKFINMPLYENAQTYLAFINSDRLNEFNVKISGMVDLNIQRLKLYLSYGEIKLIDADKPEKTVI